jgi:hypothetical protein
MTRAIDRLIVSGAVDAARESDRVTPMGWVLERLGLRDALEQRRDGPEEIARGAARFLLRVNRHDPAAAALAARAEPVAGRDGEEVGQLVLFSDREVATLPPAITLPELLPVPRPPAPEPRRLSFSAIALYRRCSLRFWAERVAGMRPSDKPVSLDDLDEGLLATEVGDAVHRLLELVDLDDPRAPSFDDLVVHVTNWYPSVSGEELGRIGSLVEAYCSSILARRVASLRGARPERPFAFEHDDVLFRGRLDVLWHEGPRALVVDYKTNTLGDSSPAEIVDSEYGLQRDVYARAVLLAGAEEVEIAYQFLERPDDVVSQTYTRGDLAGLGELLSAAIARVRSGVFEPTPDAFVCQGCPLLDITCAGPALLGVTPPPSSSVTEQPGPTASS